jgi:hypothetical protein
MPPAYFKPMGPRFIAAYNAKYNIQVTRDFILFFFLKLLNPILAAMGPKRVRRVLLWLPGGPVRRHHAQLRPPRLPQDGAASAAG